MTGFVRMLALALWVPPLVLYLLVVEVLEVGLTVGRASVSIDATSPGDPRGER